MFDAPWFDAAIVRSIQHGYDQLGAYTNYLVKAYNPQSTFLEKSWSYWQYLLSQGDPRTKHWPLMDWRAALAVTVGYLWLIATLYLVMKYIPPMKNWSTGFNVKPIALIHNIILTLLSLYMMIEIIYQSFFVQKFNIFGNSVDRSNNGLGLARIVWVFYVSKILEFIDTILMVLRKSFRQISFLHIYHHSSIYVIWWIVTYWIPGGEVYFSAMLNSGVHVIMYGYYLWASLAPKLAAGQKPTPTHPAFYRQYITTMQMTQFMLNLLQSIYLVTVPSGFPRWAAWLLFGYMLTMLALFGNFAYQQYGGSKRKARKLTEATKKVQ